eukprot:scaffold298893_cov52-Prasinocladus_malaysianus.AAC.1
MELCYSPQFGAAKDPVNMAGMIAANSLRGQSPLVSWESELPAIIGTKERTTLLVDVREEVEFVREHVPGAVSFPLSSLREHMQELKDLAAGRKVHVHCQVGQRAYYGVRAMRLNGLDAYNVTGGMTSYKYAKEAASV